MKTKNKFFFLSVISLISLSLLLSACSDDGDTTPPVINLISPEEGAVLKIGSDIHFDMELSDNEKLASYKVNIHNNFDGHTHNTKASEIADQTVAFTFDKTWDDIAGKKNADIHHHEIVISPNATPGKYHLVVYCTDEAGNESHVARNIVLSQDAEEPDHDHDH